MIFLVILHTLEMNITNSALRASFAINPEISASGFIRGVKKKTFSLHDRTFKFPNCFHCFIFGSLYPEIYCLRRAFTAKVERGIKIFLVEYSDCISYFQASQKHLTNSCPFFRHYFLYTHHFLARSLLHMLDFMTSAFHSVAH